MHWLMRMEIRSPLSIAASLVYWLLLLGLPASTYAGNDTTRGIWIGAHAGEGATGRMRLYSGYYALVIGCSSYRSGWPMLPNPREDVEEVAKALKDMGFEVRLVVDPNGDELRREINNLVAGRGQDPELAILLYFAGHGYTLTQADGAKLGYIVPIDAPDPQKNLAVFLERAVSMRHIEQISTSILSRHVLMCFDSCFSGAIFSLVRAMPSQFIREQVAKPVRTFITAGDENENVPDESVFKTVFIQALTESYADTNGDGYITGQELGAYIQESVVNYSEGSQHPQFGKIRNPKLDKGDFVFVKSEHELWRRQVAAIPRSQLEQPAIVVEESSAAVGNLSYTSNLDKVAFELLGQTFQTKRGKWLTIKNLPIGSYRLAAHSQGYLPWLQEIDIKVSETTKVVIWLVEQQKESEQKPLQAAPSIPVEPPEAQPAAAQDPTKTTALVPQETTETSGGDTIKAEQKMVDPVSSVEESSVAQSPVAGEPLKPVTPVQQGKDKPPIQAPTKHEQKPTPSAPSTASELAIDANTSVDSRVQTATLIKEEKTEPARDEVNKMTQTPEAVIAEKSAPNDRDSHKRKILDSLLAQADKAYADDRLTTPAGRNALEYYQQALAMEKANPQACKGVMQIAGRLLFQAGQALDKFQLTAAESKIAKTKTLLEAITQQTPQEHAGELIRIKKDLDQLRLKCVKIKAEARSKPRPQVTQPAKPVPAAPSKKPSILKEEFTTQNKEMKMQTQSQGKNNKGLVTPKILKEKLY